MHFTSKNVNATQHGAVANIHDLIHDENNFTNINKKDNNENSYSKSKNKS